MDAHRNYYLFWIKALLTHVQIFLVACLKNILYCCILQCTITM